MAKFPSEEWLRHYKDVINMSAAFRIAATDWEGDVTYVIEAEPEKGLVVDAWGWFDLWHGMCRDVRVVTPDEGDRAAFVIRGTYSRWKDVIHGRLEPGKAMLQGKLRLKGDLPKIEKQKGAVNVLVSLAAQIPTEFMDEE